MGRDQSLIGLIPLRCRFIVKALRKGVWVIIDAYDRYVSQNIDPQDEWITPRYSHDPRALKPVRRYIKDGVPIREYHCIIRRRNRKRKQGQITVSASGLALNA